MKKNLGWRPKVVQPIILSLPPADFFSRQRAAGGGGGQIRNFHSWLSPSVGYASQLIILYD
jgi:hypothetical protein